MDQQGELKTVIRVEVVPRSSVNRIMEREKGVYRVKVTSPPVEGKANKAVMESLARYFSVPQGSIRILSGLKSRNKIIEVSGR